MFTWLKKLSGQAAAKVAAGEPALAAELQHPAPATAAPPNGDALTSAAYVYLCDGEFEQAAILYARLIALDPGNAKAHRNTGYCLIEQGREHEAVTSLATAIQLDPDSADAHYMMGKCMAALHGDASAINHFKRSLHLDADQPFAYRDLCIAYASAGDYIAARETIDKGVIQCPDFAELYYFQGTTYAQLQEFPQAAVSFERAASAGLESAQLHYNHGIALQALHRFDDALASYGRAVTLDPSMADAHFNESVCHLLQGSFDKGWDKFEWRWETGSMAGVRPLFAKPLWLGRESLEGKTILLVAEQGYGDTIQMCRYAQLVAQRGARVLLIVPVPLRKLLSHVPGVASLLTNDDVLPYFDYYCPLMSLPLAFGTTADTIFAPARYVESDPEIVERLRPLLGERTSKIGLVWRGNPSHTNDHNRSLTLEAMYGLVDADHQFFSLQKDLPPADTRMLEERGQIADLGRYIGDFADTAAMIALLDLVITVDTAVAHLAGAMGKPVWLMLARNPDWRWLSEGDSSRWYPSMRIFRQASVGDWGNVIEQVRIALPAHMAEPMEKQFEQAKSGGI